MNLKEPDHDLTFRENSSRHRSFARHRPCQRPRACYASVATQRGVDTLVKHFAAALGSRRIRVNAVAPGDVHTDFSNFTKAELGHDVALGIQTLKRLTASDDVGGVVAFLASDEAR